MMGLFHLVKAVSFLVAQPLVHVMGVKLACVFAQLLMATFVFAQMLPQEMAILLFSSAVVAGFGNAILWTA